MAAAALPPVKQQIAVLLHGRSDTLQAVLLQIRQLANQTSEWLTNLQATQDRVEH